MNEKTENKPKEAGDGLILINALKIWKIFYQMIRCFFKGGQHEDRLLHFSEAVPCDAEDLTAAGHQICQKCDVPAIDGHAVALHRVVDLGHDRLTRGLDAQHWGYLVGVVRGCFAGEDTYIKFRVVKAL